MNSVHFLVLNPRTQQVVLDSWVVFFYLHEFIAQYSGNFELLTGVLLLGFKGFFMHVMSWFFDLMITAIIYIYISLSL